MKFALTLTLALSLIVGVGTSRADSNLSNTQEHIFKHNLHTSQSVVNWWKHRGHWALFTRHEKCSEVKGKARAVCLHARKSLRAHAARISRLTALLAPPPPVYGPMSSICGLSCINCESGGNPMAWNSAGYWGLYQFDYGTWVAHGGPPAMYGHADASMQHLIASRIKYDAWPNC